MNLVVTILIGFIGYVIAKWFKLPAPGMVGSMIAVGIMNVLFSNARMPFEIKILTQAISGAFIGLQVQKRDVMQFKNLYKPIIVLLVLLTINTFVIGIIITFVSSWDITTALLSCVPGGVSDISLMSIDMGADTSKVALMQLIRLVGTLILFPLWINLLTEKESVLQENENDHVVVISNNLNIFLSKFLKGDTRKVLFTLFIAIVAGTVGYITKLPSGVLVFSMILTAFFNCYTLQVYLPNRIRIIAQILAGSLVGCSITMDSILGIPSIVIPALLLMIGYLSVNFIYSRICLKYRLLDVKSSMFAACPAGLSDMALIAGDFGADIKTTAIIQVSRLVFAIGVMPFLITLFILFY